MAGAPGLVCLVGEWAGGGALITSHPVRVASDPLAALDSLSSVRDQDAVGGGWFGWLAYDGPSYLGWYDHVLRLVDGQWWFETLDPARQGTEDDLGRNHLQRWSGPRSRRVEFGGADRARHLAAVEAAIGAIRAGEIYQVNVCTRLSAAFAGSGIDVFAGLAELQPAFGAYLAADGREVISASPELFLRRRGRDVLTKPIKGTLPRDVAGNDARLRASAKDAAENVMIVDLVRNDLGRVCETGSVQATSLLDVEAHPGVWHLVSSVRGRLRDDVGDGDLLRATFPPGSVTGAPKLRALDEIAAVEAGPRGVYTGAIGFSSPAWGAEFSVAIRTFEIADGRIALGVGGGITADSVPMLEWRECLHKAAPLLAAIGATLAPDVATPPADAEPWEPAGGLLETILVLDGRPVRLADHLARLDRSSRELYGRPVPDLRTRIDAVATGERAVVRVVLAADGTADVTCAPLGPPPTSSHVRVVRGRDGLWRHKWADRTRLAADEADGTPLYVASDETVLETSRGNVFLVPSDGALVTPPLRDDLLPGVTRRAVLDLARDRGWRVELRNVTLGELRTNAAFWTSSLSGAVPIKSVDGHALPRRDGFIKAIGTSIVR